MNRHWQIAAYSAAVAVLSAVFFAQGLLSLQHKSATFDEVAYYGIGEYALKKHRFDVPGAGTHPPLAFYLSALPSLGQPLDARLWTYPDAVREQFGSAFTLAHDHVRGNALLARDTPPGRGLDRGRTVVLALAFLLGPMIFLWAHRLFSPAAACAALVLFAFDPNLLAHARLTTPDFPLTVMCFGAFFAASVAASGGPGVLRWIAAGVFTGLALLSKHSALAMLPALVLPFWLGGDGPWRARLRPLLGVAGVAIAVFVLGYQLQPGHFIESLWAQIQHAGGGHRGYLFGEARVQGWWWYYYLAAMAIKTPLPLLLLLAFSFVGGALRGLPRRELAGLLALPAILLAVFTLVPGPNIGLRYVLPVYPFLIVIAAGGAQIAWQRRSTRIVLVLVLAFQAASTLRSYPDYLPYFNELVGGPSHGYEYLVDSNLDWGQDLKQLKAYMDGRDLETIRLAYFGSADPAIYGIRYEPLKGYALGQDLAAPAAWHGVVAVSATLLTGTYLDDDVYEELRERPPDAVIGHSIFVYDFD